jgi:copper ion binding protein
MAVTRSSFTVLGMTCAHCVAAVTAEVAKVPHVSGVEIDLATGSVTVESTEPLDAGAIADAVDEAGYEVAP